MIFYGLALYHYPLTWHVCGCFVDVLWMLCGCLCGTWPEHCILCPFRDDGISSTFQEHAGGRHVDASISLAGHAAQGAGIGSLGHAIIAVKVDDGVGAGEIWQDVSECPYMPLASLMVFSRPKHRKSHEIGCPQIKWFIMIHYVHSHFPITDENWAVGSITHRREFLPVATPWESKGSNPSPYNVTSVSPRAVPRLGLSEVTWGVPGRFKNRGSNHGKPVKKDPRNPVRKFGALKFLG